MMRRICRMDKKIRPVWLTVLFLVFFGVIVSIPACQRKETDYRDLDKNGRLDPYEDSKLSVEKRVEDLLMRMTLEEKVGQMIHGSISPDTEGMPPEHFYAWPGYEPEGLEKGITEDMVGFLLLAYTPNPGAAARCTNKIQEWAENSRLGIPVVISMDSVHGLSYVGGATIGPYQLGLAAARNLDLIRKLAEILAKESRAVGIHQTLGPGADVGTEPRWGRIMETSGEDAELAAKMVRAQIEILQGNTLSPSSLLCTTKHFPGAGPERDGVDAVDVRKLEMGQNPLQDSMILVDKETLQYHLKPFEAAIKAGTGSIMPYYSPVSLYDNVPALGSYKILVELLREELGFDGIICSDWGPINTVMFRGFEREDSIRMVIGADTDVLGGTTPMYIGEVVNLMKRGEIQGKEIDDSVRRILRVKFLLGLFENPYVDPEQAVEVVGCDEHQEFSLQAARESMTLLKNNGVLPLSKDAKILVAGPRSSDMESLAGGWTGYPQPGLTLYDAIANMAVQKDNVVHVLADVKEAAKMAREVDVAVVAVGENAYVHTSPWGPEQLTLEENQLNLIKAIQATGTPTVVVLLMGRPYVIPWCAQNVSGILAAYHPGTRGGEAIADVLFGDFNPTGKLPFQMPRSMDQIRNQREDLPFDIEDPLYDFGYSLSYKER